MTNELGVNEYWSKRRAQQGTGVNRAPIELTRITEAMCLKAMKVTCGNSKDADDARFLLGVLGLVAPQVDEGVRDV